MRQCLISSTKKGWMISYNMHFTNAVEWLFQQWKLNIYYPPPNITLLFLFCDHFNHSLEWTTIQNEKQQKVAFLMKILYWCVRFLMNQSLDFNNENWKCVKLKCPEMKITMIPHTWWWAVISHRSVCPACLWLSNDWDSLIEVVLGTSRKEFNLSG